jgi:hypothetical protein
LTGERSLVVDYARKYFYFSSLRKNSRDWNFSFSRERYQQTKSSETRARFALSVRRRPKRERES